MTNVKKIPKTMQTIAGILFCPIRNNREIVNRVNKPAIMCFPNYQP